MSSDEQLLAELAEAMRAARAVPDAVVEGGRMSYSLFDVDAELAELTFDSAEQPAGVATGTRAEAGTERALTFVAGEITIEIEVTVDALQGQIVPLKAGQITLSRRDGSTSSAPVDEVGWFSFSPRPSGLFRLQLRTPAGAIVHTVWAEL